MGPPKIGKSWAALDVALGVACGGCRARPHPGRRSPPGPLPRPGVMGSDGCRTGVGGSSPGRRSRDSCTT
ncbi:MAG: helicase RepA family protein [Acidimicrobiia bacterium]|nr:helicase RepA family protein [Acidimicrobiia bacterium]